MLTESRIKHSLLQLSSIDNLPSWGGEMDFPTPTPGFVHKPGRTRRKTEVYSIKVKARLKEPCQPRQEKKAHKLVSFRIPQSKTIVLKTQHRYSRPLTKEAKSEQENTPKKDPQRTLMSFCQREKGERQSLFYAIEMSERNILTQRKRQRHLDDCFSDIFKKNSRKLI